MSVQYEDVEEIEEEQNSDPKGHSQSEYEVLAAIPKQREREKQFGRVGADRRKIGNRRRCYNCRASAHFKAEVSKTEEQPHKVVRV